MLEDWMNMVILIWTLTKNLVVSKKSFNTEIWAFLNTRDKFIIWYSFQSGRCFHCHNITGDRIPQSSKISIAMQCNNKFTKFPFTFLNCHSGNNIALIVLLA